MTGLLIPAAVFGALYTAAAALGLVFFVVAPENIAALWPPSGVLLGALLVRETRHWPALLALAFAILLTANLIVGTGVPFAVVLAGSNALEGVMAAGLLRLGRGGRETRVDSATDWLRLLAVPLAPATAGLVAAGGAHLLAGRPFLGTWEIWIVSDTLGMALLAPLLVLAAAPSRPLRDLACLEGAVLLAGLLAACFVVFGEPYAHGTLLRTMAYVPLPFLVWAGIRFGSPGAAASGLVLGAVAIGATRASSGPFAGPPLDERDQILTLQLYLGFSMLFVWAPAGFVAAVRRRERFNRRVLDSLSANVAVLDAAGKVTALNRAWEQFAASNGGWGQKLGVGVDYLEVCRGASNEEPEAARALYGILEVLSGRNPVFELEYACHSPTEQRWFVMRFTPMPGGGAVVAHEDVTQRVQLSEQLRHAQKMDSLGRLAGGVAHDFNNLLTAILGHLDVAVLDPNSAEGMDSLATARQTALRAGELTAQLLAVARRQVTEPKIVDPAGTVRDLERVLLPVLGESIELQVEADTERCVKIDPSQLQQVLLNLAINARDAMPKGGLLTLRVTEQEVPDGESSLGSGWYVRIDVVDTGSGILPEDMPNVFEPFFTTKGGHGTGLGLSTAYGIARQHAGDLRATSRVGEGTEFSLLLPVCDERAVAPPPEPKPEPRRASGTVLVVEDQEAVRAFVARRLGQAGYKVRSAASAEEALELIADGGSEIDVLVSDVALPALDGLEMARRLRGRFPHVKVLLISGHVPPDVSAIREVATAFLPKPFSGDDLLRTLREIGAGGD